MSPADQEIVRAIVHEELAKLGREISGFIGAAIAVAATNMVRRRLSDGARD